MKFRWMVGLGSHFQYHIFCFPDPLDHPERLNDRLAMAVEDGWEPVSISHAPSSMYPTGLLLMLCRRDMKDGKDEPYLERGIGGPVAPR